ncbi:MAG: hypothetical protein S4CHLAM2_09800 [Chlamydiales bacterium]|nr:hypothetical protein [Chlamydiales bacterium]
MNEQALKDRLQTIAKEKRIQFNHCWKQLQLERFLSRLARSSLCNKFIFKGGFLLSYLIKLGRETTDLDFLLTHMQVGGEEIQAAFNEITQVSTDDGFSFSYQSLSPLMQPHMHYPGYRATLQTHFGKMRDKIHIDVGVGDIVTPQPLDVQLFQYRGKPLFENHLSLQVYPIETIIAEKLETVASKGAANSRMKDYHDLYLLSQMPSLINPKNLQESLSQTFQHRGTVLQPVFFDENGLRKLQQLWNAHLNGLGDVAHSLSMPKEIRDVIAKINSLL